MSTRQFHLGDVLSVTTGCLLSPRGIEGYYDILGFMTGEELCTHQLFRAALACQPSLKGQHPQLADVMADGINRDNWEPWFAEQIARFGETLLVEPLLTGAYVAMNPIDEAVAIVGRDKMIVLEVEPVE